MITKLYTKGGRGSVKKKPYGIIYTHIQIYRQMFPKGHSNEHQKKT